MLGLVSGGFFVSDLAGLVSRACLGGDASFLLNMGVRGRRLRGLRCRRTVLSVGRECVERQSDSAGEEEGCGKQFRFDFGFLMNGCSN